MATAINLGHGRGHAKPHKLRLLNCCRASSKAHGGVNNWSKVTKVTAQLSLGGPFWGGRGWPDVYEGQTVTLDPHREHITSTPFTGTGRTSVLDVAPGTERGGDAVG